MLVTLICDASYCDRTKVAGYGYWIASQRGKLGGAGTIDWEVENNNTAEMMAICNTLYHACGAKLIYPGDRLLIQTDCLSAIDKMKGLNINTIQEQAVVAYFDKAIHRNGLTVEFRHVRGHTNNPDARSAANRACDTRAKRAMREARRKKIVEDARHELEMEP